MYMQNRHLELIITFVVGFGLGALIFAQKPANAPTIPLSTDQKQVAIVPAPVLSGEVSIGALLPLSGSASDLGGALQKSVNLAVNEINATGGVGGKKLVVNTEDGKCDNNGALIASKKLFNEEKLKFVIGGGCSEETLAAAPIANASKGILISPESSLASLTTKGGPYVLRFSPSEALSGNAAATYAYKELSAKRMAVFYENTEKGLALANAFMTTFDKLGGGVVVKMSYTAGATDFSRMSTAMKNASNLNAVYVVAESQGSGIALVRTLGASLPILTNETLFNPDVIQNNRDLLDGITTFRPTVPTADKMRSFTDAYRKAYEAELLNPIAQANAYSEVYLAKMLIEKDLLNAEKMLGELVSLKDWSGGALEGVTLDASGDIQWKSWDVKRVSGGDVLTVKTIEL